MKKVWLLIGIVIVSILVSESCFAASQAKVRLKLPKKGYMVGTKPLLVWGSLPEASQYTLELSENEDFSSINLRIEDIAATSWGSEDEWKETQIHELEVEKTYSWRVASDLKGSQSDPYNFTVGYALRVTVKDDNHNPIDNASVNLFIDGARVSNSTTDAEGMATVFGIGSCRLLVTSAKYKSSCEKVITMDRNKNERCTLTEKGTLKIGLEDEEGNLIKNAHMTLTPTAGEGSQSEYDLTTGSLSIDVLQGTYTYEITAEGYEEEKDSIQITADEETTLSLILKRSRYDITVKVQDSDGKKIELAWVFLDNTLAGITDGNGILIIQEVTHGSHKFHVLKDGYLPDEPKEKDVTPSETTIQTTLEPIIKEEPKPSGVILGFISIPLIVALFLLYIRMNSALKKINSQSDKIIKNQETVLKESRKDINTMKEYIADILEKT